jgi:hypothetical protein
MPNNYAAIPEFGQLVEYVTQGSLVNGVYGVVINRVKMDNFDLSNLLMNTNLQSDYSKVTAIRPVSDLIPAELAALKTNLAVTYHTDVVALTVVVPNPVPIVNSLVTTQSRASWKTGLAVTIGQVYFYVADKNLYQCVQAHTTQSDWTPPVCKALWKRYYEPADAPWPWVQPIGSVDAYPVGAKVTFGGYTWQNTIAANVWQPGVTGWTNLTPPVSPNWSYPVAYKVGDVVIYTPNGFTYKCLQAHTSNISWTPPAAVSLWQRM